jgi:hypothetical protein
MSHGPTKIASKGVCIYCRKSHVRLTDEHVVPLSLGGQHILEDASCQTCADITKRFEQDVAREMWGDARNSYNAPSRRKKLRKTHIHLTDPDNPDRQVKVPYSEYPAAMVFYKMNRAGLLEGMPDTVDLSSMWQFSVIHDDKKAKEFEQKFGVKLTSKFRHVPESFARLLASRARRGGRVRAGEGMACQRRAAASGALTASPALRRRARARRAHASPQRRPAGHLPLRGRAPGPLEIGPMSLR